MLKNALFLLNNGNSKNRHSIFPTQFNSTFIFQTLKKSADEKQWKTHKKVPTHLQYVYYGKKLYVLKTNKVRQILPANFPV